ncbi:hypothetical protein ACKKBG_A33835 [Auxenochlorella protothecoides x Auxenochlorella symbiontica]
MSQTSTSMDLGPCPPENLDAAHDLKLELAAWHSQFGVRLQATQAECIAVQELVASTVTRLEDSVIKMHSTVSSMLGKEEGQA